MVKLVDRMILSSDACMTLLIPGIIRNQLTPLQIIECSAYLTKRVQLSGGRIDLQLNIVELLAKASSSFTDAQLKSFEILQRKAEVGHKDVDGFIKTKIINAEPISIVILIGKAGIIDSDIKHELKEAIAFYKINFVRINLTSEKQIIEARGIERNPLCPKPKSLLPSGCLFEINNPPASA
ncbi:MAG: hypothetical protein ABJA79_10560 [Parafilimonas sp.]